MSCQSTLDNLIELQVTIVMMNDFSLIGNNPRLSIWTFLFVFG